VPKSRKGRSSPPAAGASRSNVRHVGLARALSKLGHCSRSQAAILIRDGLVQLNGRRRLDPEAPVDLQSDTLAVGERTVTARSFVYLMLNKPSGVVTSASDEKGRATVYAYLDQHLPWVAPVGRLDKASEGLLLITNDTEWAGRILAPQSTLEKVYHVQIRAHDPDAVAERLADGIDSRGDRLRALRVSILRRGRTNAWLEIVLTEGKNRHIRRMLESCSVPVLRLVRVSIGPLTLGKLAKGGTRLLSPAEKALLDPARSDRN
jgi:23S rRNA pseudouridine2605 synthase